MPFRFLILLYCTSNLYPLQTDSFSQMLRMQLISRNTLQVIKTVSGSHTKFTHHVSHMRRKRIRAVNHKLQQNINKGVAHFLLIAFTFLLQTLLPF